MVTAPCPFCGNPNPSSYEIDVGKWAVFCHQCEANGPSAPNEKAAIRLWNTGGLKSNAPDVSVGACFGKR